MSTVNKEGKTYFGRCRCCLGYGYLNNMWEEYHNGEKIEVFGEMLIQCFALSWEHPESVEHDQICEICVQRLRNAYTFRELVIKSQTELMLEIENDKLAQTKFEVDIKDVKIEAPDNLPMESVTVTYDRDESCNEEAEGSSMDAEDIEKDVIYEDIEYLEEDLITETKGTVTETIPTRVRRKGSKNTLKPYKKLPPHERNKRYLQYTKDDLFNAMEAVRTNKMSRIEAAQLYKVPRKTLMAKLREEKKEGRKDPSEEATYKFLKEVKTILTYTNGTPYKSKTLKYSCIYCTFTLFDDAEELRNHTRKVHMDDRTKKIDIVMRPYWLNEILKLDIENLLCVVCCTPIYHWNGMFQHMKDVHKIVFEYAPKRVIPYTLRPELECALCKEKFFGYHQLDGHMNTHYDNYVCGTCGDTFITVTRLKSHMKIHEMGTWPCEYCSKVFTSEKNKSKHEGIVHKNALFYKCMHCNARFNTLKGRNAHLAEMHVDKICKTTCELCGKTFNWKHNFLGHMRKVHSNRRHECTICGKRYYYKSKLEDHIAVKHRAEKKYSCDYCEKMYSSKQGLHLHLKRHEES